MLKKMLVVVSLLLLTACASTDRRLTIARDNYYFEDYQKAKQVLKQPLKEHDPDAEYAMGYMYYYGKGVTEDRKLAKQWFLLAASQGQPDAIRALKMIGKREAQMKRKYSV